MTEQPTPEPQNVTRRKFIKRSGGATVGTAIGLYALQTPAWAAGEDDSSVVWAMLCTRPNAEDQPIIGTKPNIEFGPPGGGQTIFVTLKLEADSTKYKDSPGINPYWTCEFSHSFKASIDVAGTPTKLSVRNFWTYCNPADGHITWSQISSSPGTVYSSAFNLNGWSARVGVEMAQSQIDEPGVNPRRTLTLSTGARAHLKLETNEPNVPTPVIYMTPWVIQVNQFESQRL